MRLSNIIVQLKIKPGVINERIFSDWYDFADWLKEEQQHQREATIVGWRYDRGRV